MSEIATSHTARRSVGWLNTWLLASYNKCCPARDGHAAMWRRKSRSSNRWDEEAYEIILCSRATIETVAEGP